MASESPQKAKVHHVTDRVEATHSWGGQMIQHEKGGLALPLVNQSGDQRHDLEEDLDQLFLDSIQ